MDNRDSDRTSPSGQIIATTLVVGGVCFILGYLGPLMFSDSNLGPLLGIFITGPVGILVGALIGIIRSAFHAGERSIRIELWWLGSVWVLSLLYTLAYDLAGPGLVTLGVQALVIASGSLLLVSSKVQKHFSNSGRKCGSIVLSAAILIALASTVPPVTRPSWGPQRPKSSALASESLPKFAFAWDPRFDASRHVPVFVVDSKMLVCEWIAIAGVAGIVIAVIVARNKRLIAWQRV